MDYVARNSSQTLYFSTLEAKQAFFCFHLCKLLINEKDLVEVSLIATLAIKKVLPFSFFIYQSEYFFSFWYPNKAPKNTARIYSSNPADKSKLSRISFFVVFEVTFYEAFSRAWGNDSVPRCIDGGISTICDRFLKLFFCASKELYRNQRAFPVFVGFRKHGTVPLLPSAS